MGVYGLLMTQLGHRYRYRGTTVLFRYFFGTFGVNQCEVKYYQTVSSEGGHPSSRQRADICRRTIADGLFSTSYYDDYYEPTSHYNRLAGS